MENETNRTVKVDLKRLDDDSFEVTTSDTVSDGDSLFWPSAGVIFHIVEGSSSLIAFPDQKIEIPEILSLDLVVL